MAAGSGEIVLAWTRLPIACGRLQSAVVLLLIKQMNSLSR